jgi:multiple sugar transport system permease protein
MNNVAGRATNPDGSNMAGGVLLAIPPVVLFLIFQKHFTSTNIGSGVKG